MEGSWTHSRFRTVVAHDAELLARGGPSDGHYHSRNVRNKKPFFYYRLGNWALNWSINPMGVGSTPFR